MLQMLTRSFMEVLPPAAGCYPSSGWLLGQRRDSSGGGGGGRGWTIEENKRFEDALARVDIGAPNCWEWVAALIPGKTARDVMEHYEELEKDVIEIEAGRLPYRLSPPSSSASASSFTLDWDNNYTFDGGFKQPYCIAGRRSSGGGRTAADHERKKGIPWTEEEHRLFLLGLKKHGKGDWRSISRNYVATRTPTQVASHAQKYFIRLNSSGKDKRRSSIHDTTTANLPDTTTTPLSPPSSHSTRVSSAQLSSTIGDSKKPPLIQVSSLFNMSTHEKNQYLQSQFGSMDPYRMKLQQAQSSQSIKGSVPCDMQFRV